MFCFDCLLVQSDPALRLKLAACARIPLALEADTRYGPRGGRGWGGISACGREQGQSAGQHQLGNAVGWSAGEERVYTRHVDTRQKKLQRTSSPRSSAARRRPHIWTARGPYAGRHRRSGSAWGSATSAKSLSKQCLGSPRPLRGQASRRALSPRGAPGSTPACSYEAIPRVALRPLCETDATEAR